MRPAGSPLLVLDVGCGSGLSGAVLSGHGIRWVGTDISADMLGIAQQVEVWVGAGGGAMGLWGFRVQGFKAG